MLFVYDSVDQIVYCSGWLDGVPTSQYTAEAFHLKIKYGKLSYEDNFGPGKPILRSNLCPLIVAELFLDWFIMAYLNGLRAFAARSASRSLTRKRVSLDRWEAAVKVAERGRAYLRAADTEAAAKNWTEAEDLACRGIELLRERYFSISVLCLNEAQEQHMLIDNTSLVLGNFQEPSSHKDYWTLATAPSA